MLAAMARKKTYPFRTIGLILQVRVGLFHGLDLNDILTIYVLPNLWFNIVLLERDLGIITLYL